MNNLTSGCCHKNRHRREAESHGFRIKALTALLLGAGLLMGASMEANSGAALLRQLDRHYYYPQRHGLKRLSAQINLSRVNPFSEDTDQTILRYPTVQMLWTAESPFTQFFLEEQDRRVPSERDLEIMNLITPYREVFVPIPLSEKLSGHRLVRRKKGLRWVEAQFKTDQDRTVTGYDLWIDPKKNVIARLVMKRRRMPREITSRLAHAQRGGFWLAAESRSRYVVSGKEFEETLKYTYDRIGTFWLLTQVVQEVERDGVPVGTFFFNLTGHQVN
ncbi:MAG: hypothetical protein ACE5ER_09605 [Nitrospinaceae bacterium]